MGRSHTRDLGGGQYEIIDDNGNVRYGKYAEGVQCWMKYKSGKIIYKKKCDKIGQLILERWYEYDKNGNCVHIKDDRGLQTWFEYDEHGNCIHLKDSTGYQEWNEYDEDKNLIHSKWTVDGVNYEEVYY